MCEKQDPIGGRAATGKVLLGKGTTSGLRKGIVQFREGKPREKTKLREKMRMPESRRGSCMKKRELRGGVGTPNPLGQSGIIQGEARKEPGM